MSNFCHGSVIRGAKRREITPFRYWQCSLAIHNYDVQVFHTTKSGGKQTILFLIIIFTNRIETTFSNVIGAKKIVFTQLYSRFTIIFCDHVKACYKATRFIIYVESPNACLLTYLVQLHFQ